MIQRKEYFLVGKFEFVGITMTIFFSRKSRSLLSRVVSKKQRKLIISFLIATIQPNSMIANLEC